MEGGAIYGAVLRAFFGYLVALAIMLAVCLVFALLIVWLLPGKWQTTPVFMGIGIVLYAAFRAFLPSLERRFQDRFQWLRYAAEQKERGESPPPESLGREVGQQPPPELPEWKRPS